MGLSGCCSLQRVDDVSCRRASATCPRWSSGTPTRSPRRSSRRSSGSGARRRALRPTCSIRPTARDRGRRRVVLEPEVRARIEEELRVGRALAVRVQRRVDGEREVPLDARKSWMAPLCIQSQRPWRNGWQFVCWTGVPVEARMCAKTVRERTWPAVRAGCGRSTPARCCGRPPARPPSPYQPTPKPSPFVVSAPSRECRLWSIREWVGM